MSKRPWKILLQDILEAIEKIEEYAANVEFDDFTATPMMVDAVVRNIEIIGEVASKIPSRVRKKYPDVPWQKIKGTRNRIVHEYFGVDLNIIWFIVKNELAPLKQQVKTILNE